MIDARSYLTLPEGSHSNTDDQVIGIAVHHSATLSNPSATPTMEESTLRLIDAYHVRTFGMFAYHLAAFASGRCYQTGDLESQRAHVAKRNHELRGIVMIGDFTREQPTEGHWEALREGLNFILARYPDREIRGHREWALPTDPTACPGIVVPKDWEAFLEEDELSEADKKRIEQLELRGQVIRTIAHPDYVFVVRDPDPVTGEPIIEILSGRVTDEALRLRIR